MTRTSNIVIGTLAAIALIVGIVAYHKVPSQITGKQGPVGAQGPKGDRGPAGPEGVAGKTGTTFGAVATLDGVDFPYVNIGGSRYYYYKQTMTATSSVICSIRNPFNATSTPLNYSAVITANPAAGLGIAANILDLSTSTTQYGTSSPALIKAYNLAAGAQATIPWTQNGTTTNANIIGFNGLNLGVSDVFLRPGEYLNFKNSTSTAGVDAGGYYTGVCSALFKLL